MSSEENEIFFSIAKKTGETPFTTPIFFNGEILKPDENGCFRFAVDTENEPKEETKEKNAPEE